VQTREVPWIVGSGRSDEAVSPQAQERTFLVAYRRIGVGGARIPCTSNREVRFPDLIGTVDLSADRWHESGASGFRHSGFPAAGTLESRIREPRNPEADVAAWAPNIQWSTGGVKPIDRRFGTRGFDM
jgi:hypothetical protein